MTTRYVADASMVSAMARELRVLQSLERRGLARMVLSYSGFTAAQIAVYFDRALENERRRRIALAREAS